jgi:uracil-DNA glycosylase
MSKEQQLYFDISRCSLCPFGANRTFIAPSLPLHADTIILLESPTVGVCDSQNPWKTAGASFLSRAIHHAFGTDLSRFHLTFVSKCHPQLDGAVPPVRKRRDWAQVCASHYLTRELSEIRPRQMILFGELPARVCFPDLEQSWDALQGQTFPLQPQGLPVTFFEQLTKLQKVGLDSLDGEAFLLKLHEVLGGTYSPPDPKEESNLFDFF